MGKGTSSFLQLYECERHDPSYSMMWSFWMVCPDCSRRILNTKSPEYSRQFVNSQIKHVLSQDKQLSDFEEFSSLGLFVQPPKTGYREKSSRKMPGLCVCPISDDRRLTRKPCSARGPSSIPAEADAQQIRRCRSRDKLNGVCHSSLTSFRLLP